LGNVATQHNTDFCCANMLRIGYGEDTGKLV